MNLKKIIVLEITASIVLLLGAVFFLKITPYLQPSRQNNTIGLYDSISYPKNTINLIKDGFVNVPFKYSSYDPAIIILELSVQSCQEPGYLAIYCNYRKFALIYLEPETPILYFNMISFSGSDWIEPPSAMFGLNELLFESESQNGFAGILTYQITLRGSR